MLLHVEKQWNGRTFAALGPGSEPGSATCTLMQVLHPTDVLCVDALPTVKYSAKVRRNGHKLSVKATKQGIKGPRSQP